MVVQVTALTCGFPLHTAGQIPHVKYTRYHAHWASRSYQLGAPVAQWRAIARLLAHRGCLWCGGDYHSSHKSVRGERARGPEGERNPFASRAMRKGGARASRRASTATLAELSSPWASSALAVADEETVYARAR